MNPPSLREICAKATKGPWHTDPDKRMVLGPPSYPVPVIIATTSFTHQYSEPSANAQLIARFSPATALAVYEALTEAENVMQISANIQDINKGVPVTYDLAVGLKRVLPIVRRSIALLDGRTEP